MAVLFPNISATITVHAHPARRDARGMPVVDTVATTRGPVPARVLEQQDLTWTVAIDPSAGPLRADDTFTDGTRTWVLTGNPRTISVAGYSDVDYITATAVLEPPKVP